MTEDELKEILKDHKNWLDENDIGHQADLSDADLTGIDLPEIDLDKISLKGVCWRGTYLSQASFDEVCMSKSDLHGTDFSNAHFRGVDLSNANLSGANFSHARFSEVNFSNADLSGADLSETYFEKTCFKETCFNGADLKGARFFKGVDFYGADLRGANLSGIEFDSDIRGLLPLCPMEGSFIAYKKATDKIVVLEIPADARRVSGTTLKCRCDKAKVLRIEDADGEIIDVDEDEDFIYMVGNIIVAKNFNPYRWNNYGSGITFYLSKEIALREKFFVDEDDYSIFLYDRSDDTLDYKPIPEGYYEEED